MGPRRARERNIAPFWFNQAGVLADGPRRSFRQVELGERLSRKWRVPLAVVSSL